MLRLLFLIPLFCFALPNKQQVEFALRDPQVIIDNGMQFYDWEILNLKHILIPYIKVEFSAEICQLAKQAHPADTGEEDIKPGVYFVCYIRDKIYFHSIIPRPHIDRENLSLDASIEKFFNQLEEDLVANKKNCALEIACPKHISDDLELLPNFILDIFEHIMQHETLPPYLAKFLDDKSLGSTHVKHKEVVNEDGVVIVQRNDYSLIDRLIAFGASLKESNEGLKIYRGYLIVSGHFRILVYELKSAHYLTKRAAFKAVQASHEALKASQESQSSTTTDAAAASAS